MGTIVHAFNRAVERRTIFHEPGDYDAFVAMLEQGSTKGLVRIFGYCVMPNHWHLMLQAQVDDGISVFMKWLTAKHVKRYRKFHETVGYGHLYQGRFKSPVIEGEEHFLTTMRYVEANAAAAGLAPAAHDWPWSSAFERRAKHRSILSDPPQPLPDDWEEQLMDYVDGVRHRTKQERCQTP
jgi:putative transposase